MDAGLEVLWPKDVISLREDLQLSECGYLSN
jgi:hypothetical protein